MIATICRGAAPRLSSRTIAFAILVSELTDEPKALWFQNEEYSQIKQKIKCLVYNSEEAR
jgi:tRNA U34 5-carboxymethylaminomethyl modifying enzyme MnmG/GidA